MTEEKQRKMALRRDAGYRKPKEPAPKVRGPEYAMSFACFTCNTAHKRHYDAPPCDYPKSMVCPICTGNMANVGRYFKAPKKSDSSQWKKVKFLVDHGFVFQHIYEQREDGAHYRVDYPNSLNEARDFVIRYKDQAWLAP